MLDEFRWNDWNAEHATRHGCTIEEIESVVRRNLKQARQGGQEKWTVQGRGQGDRVIRVVFLVDPEPERTIYVIHAMPLTTRRRRRGR